MTPPAARLRFRAVSMEFAAYLDAHTVEMRIITDTGQSVAVVCPRDSIFAVQKGIAEMREACPEIATWRRDSRVQLAAPPNCAGVQPTHRSKHMRDPFKMTLVAIGLALGVSVAACAPTRTSESTGAYVDDASITTKVKAAILADAGLKGFEIHVATQKDVVQLSGFVDSSPMIGRASDVAGRVAGVRGVRNDLVVR